MSQTAPIPESYLVPARPAEAEIDIKKSRFIAHAYPVTNRAEALAQVQALRNQYPDARHHCWAYLIGSPQQPITQAFDDDGEPAGTAGKPILNVLNHKAFGDILVVVVRYFGGIKLGAGGLTRAYGQAAQAVMANLEGEEKVPMMPLTLFCDFSQEQQVRYLLNQVQGEVFAVNYQQQVEITAQIPMKAYPKLQTSLAGLGILAKSMEKINEN